MPTNIDITYAFSHFIPNRPVLDEFLNSPTGQVGTWLSGRGRRVVIAAKAQVGVDTGELRQSIGMSHYRGPSGQYLRIGSNNGIALLHHQGSRPHVIEARDRHQVMRFSAGGRTIYTRRVMHPGTRPNRYLSDNLRLVLI